MTTPDPAASVAGTDAVERAPRRSDELSPGSTAYWEALTGEMQGDITALRARVAELEGLIRWVGECYPATLPWSGAQVELTWQQFNGMRSAIGLKPLKPVPRRKAPDPRDARIAELEAALRSVAIERFGGDLACTDYQQMRAWRANWQKCQDIARRALGDARG